MPQVFDNFTVLDPAKELSTVQNTLGADIVDNHFQANDPATVRAGIEAATDTTIFNRWSILDPALAERQMQSVIGDEEAEGYVDRLDGYYDGTVLDVSDQELTGPLVIAASRRATLTEIRMGGNDFDALICRVCPSLETITGMEDNTHLLTVDIRGSKLTTFDPWYNDPQPIVTVDMRDNTQLVLFRLYDGGGDNEIQSVDVSGCTSLQLLYIANKATHLSTLNFTNCPALGMFVVYAAVLESIDMSANTNLTFFECASCQHLDVVTLPDANSNLLQIQLYNTNLKGYIDFSGYENLTHAIVEGSELSPNVAGLGNLQAVNMTNSHQSTPPDISSSADTLQALMLWGNSFDEDEVNTLLEQLDEGGVENGYFQALNGNALPTGDGLTAKANLEGKGWTINSTS